MKSHSTISSAFLKNYCISYKEPSKFKGKAIDSTSSSGSSKALEEYMRLEILRDAYLGLLKGLIKGSGEQPSAGAVVFMELGCVVHPVQMCLPTWKLSEPIGCRLVPGGGLCRAGGWVGSEGGGGLAYQ